MLAGNILARHTRSGMLGKRIHSPMPGSIRRVSIEGNIGAGKSTFLRMLKATPDLSFIFTPEPVEMWRSIEGPSGSQVNILEAFYQDPNRYAFTFQSFVTLSRIQTQLNTETEFVHKLGDSPPILHIVERSLLSDSNIFARNSHMTGQMSDLEISIYSETHAHLMDASGYDVDAIIYLRADPEVCHDRLKKRSRNEEVGVGLEYLSQIHDRHEEWIMNGDERREVCVLDCNLDFEHESVAWKEHQAKLTKFFQKILA